MAAAAMPPHLPRVVMSTPTAGTRRTWLVKPLLKAKPFSAGVKLIPMVVGLSPWWLVVVLRGEEAWAALPILRTHTHRHAAPASGERPSAQGTPGRSQVLPSVVSTRAARSQRS